MAGTPRQRAPKPEPREGYVAVGLITGVHGLDGEVRVESLSDNPERFQPGAMVSAGSRSLTIRWLRPHKGALLIRFDRVSSRARANELRGLLLEVPEAELGALPEGEYYRHQLIGLQVFDTQGNVLGRVEEILETGANDVYVVRDAESELLLPAIEGVVKSVNLEEGRLIVEAMAGMEPRPLKPPKRAS